MRNSLPRGLLSIGLTRGLAKAPAAGGDSKPKGKAAAAVSNVKAKDGAKGKSKEVAKAKSTKGGDPAGAAGGAGGVEVVHHDHIPVRSQLLDVL